MKVLRNVNNLSIKLKLSLGLFVLFIFFMIQFFVSFKSLAEIESSFTQLSTITKENVEILEIDRDILNLEKQILVYSYTGRESVYQQISRNHSNIDFKLQNVFKETKDSTNHKIILQMINILNTMGENIPILRNHYNYRSNIINSELPRIFAKGNEAFKFFLNSKHRVRKIETIVQNDLQLWAEINIEATKFLRTKEYRLRASVYKKLDSILRNEKYYRDYHIKAILEEYRAMFDKSIQANRVFLSLVNVVIAGDSVEFSSLVNQLKKTKLNHLDNLSKNNKNVLNTSIIFAQIISVSFIILMFLIVWFYNSSILKGLNLISKTFRDLLEGSLKSNIPGTDRKDEIGQLARGAQRFYNLNNELREAKDIAEKSEQMQASFLANMSHEIRTPMNGILGMVSLLRETVTIKEEREQLKTIQNCGDSLLRILNDILDISKIEAGKLDLEIIEFNLVDCVKEAVSLMKLQAIEKGLTLSFDSEGLEDLWFEGDITRIRQILVNYISNAIKFSISGDIVISIDVDGRDLQIQQVTFRVKDNGIGISKENAKNLFSPFTQADSSTTRKFGGTGLGLSICKKLADAMGGDVFFESNKGHGTTFGLTLTLFVCDKVEVTEKLPDLEKIELESLSITHPHNLLVVEDNKINQKIVKMTLKKLGYGCDIAENGKVALELLSKDVSAYSLIFMDMQMPVMDGVEATKRIIEKYGEFRPRIVALTANAFSEDRENCLSVGMDDFLSKPIKKEDLLRVLVKYSN